MYISSPTSRRDVQWVKDCLGRRTEPAWNGEPSLPLLELIAREHFSIPAGTLCTISPFARGAFNRLYDAHASERACLIRVTLPVEPSLKTLSEIATIEFVRTHASELVPRVLAYDADACLRERGGLGYEWMIMERIPGSVLEGRWEGMDWDAKLSLVTTVVHILAKLYDHPLPGIGNIYSATVDIVDTSDTSGPAPAPYTNPIGQIVSTTFFWDDHFDQDVPRGPFGSSHDWLVACLQFILNDTAKVIDRSLSARKADPNSGEDAGANSDSDSDSDGELEEAQETKALAGSSASSYACFPLPCRTHLQSGPSSSTTTSHPRTSSSTRLGRSPASSTGSVSALPLWRACTLPWFLIGGERAECPNPETYSKAADENESGNAERDRDEDWGGRGRPNALYFEHLFEWEKTQLRAIFLEEMERVQPEWVGAHHAGVLRNDFYTAVMYCDDELFRRRVGQWVDRVEAMADEELRGGVPGLEYESLNDTLWS